MGNRSKIIPFAVANVYGVKKFQGIIESAHIEALAHRRENLAT